MILGCDQPHIWKSERWPVWIFRFVPCRGNGREDEEVTKSDQRYNLTSVSYIRSVSLDPPRELEAGTAHPFWVAPTDGLFCLYYVGCSNSRSSG